MTPQQYIESLEKEIQNATDDYDFAYKQGMRDGAKGVVKIYRTEAKKRTAAYRKSHPTQVSEWRERNREAYNAYHREYRKRKKEGLTMVKS